MGFIDNAINNHNNPEYLRQRINELSIALEEKEKEIIKLKSRSGNDLHISDVEYKVYERMEKLESQSDFESKIRLNELSSLHGWLLNDEPY